MALAPFSDELKRMRGKLAKKVEDQTRQVNTHTLSEAKEKIQRSLDRRTNTREPVQKETLAQFVNGQGVISESPKVTALRSKLAEV